MIKLVYYYPGAMPKGEETLLRCVTLLGAMTGQVGFGFLADLYGRRKMYGIELYLMLAAILGLVMSSAGAKGSMSIFGWLFAWRFVMGIGMAGIPFAFSNWYADKSYPSGIGGDYVSSLPI